MWKKNYILFRFDICFQKKTVIVTIVIIISAKQDRKTSEYLPNTS